jgi:major membrane immunogen (membrane-anchored lipoprotein)
MNSIKHDRHRIGFLRTGMIFFIIALIGCSQSNESKIIGIWNATHDKTDIPYSVSFSFHKEGGVKTETTYMDKKIWKIGKYKFKDDNNISITWDNGKIEIINVKFQDKDKLILYGNLELNRFKSKK